MTQHATAPASAREAAQQLAAEGSATAADHQPNEAANFPPFASAADTVTFPRWLTST